MVIKPLDDSTSYAHSVVTDLRSLGLGVRGDRGWAHSVARPWVLINSTLTHIVYLLPFMSY